MSCEKILICKVHDDVLLSHDLDLYSGKRMSRETFENKKDTLYYMYIDQLIVGYVQLYPLEAHYITAEELVAYPIFKGKNFWAIEEIEIFRIYRSNKYGSKIIKSLKSVYNLLILDIQESALKFWLFVMGKEYWDSIMSLDKPENIVNKLKYSGSVASYFLSYRVI